MLVSPSGNIQKRSRLHRRQISIPAALEATNAADFPATTMQSYSVHKRGSSLDQRARLIPKDGYSTTRHPNVLRETQQQLSRLNQPYFDQPTNIHMSSTTDCQQLGPGGLNALTNQSSNENNVNYGGVDLDIETLKSRQHKTNTPNVQQQQQQQQPTKAGLSFANGLDSQLLNEQSWSHYTGGQSGIPQVYDLRRMSVQSDLSQHSNAPSTPRQIHTNYIPLTPETTPFRRTTKLATYNQNAGRSPTRNITCQTAQPAYMERTKSLQGVPGSNFAEPPIEVPSPPNTAPVDYDSMCMLTSQESDFESTEFQLPSESKMFRLNKQQTYSQTSSASGSFQSSPEIAYMPLPAANMSKAPKVPIEPATPSKSSPRKMQSPFPESPTKAKLSPKIASIDNLNLDNRVQASITETGVSIDEIASYISGPDPVDGKWVCIHPGCDRRFGRKENIKSHIQTHLGDRQYKCDHCNKCFVRGHDLKRHAKIHTGDKPYECPCGNVFARHDALTRHRQRGMCVGGYTGVVRKTTKRGRPKKNRPELDERQDKAARTRAKVNAKMSAPSVSGSYSSCDSPPSDIFESMSIQGSSPLNEMALFESNNYCLPSEVFTFTPPASPGYSTGNKPSPAQSVRSHSPYSDGGYLSASSSKSGLEDIPEEIPDLPPISEAAGCFDPEPEHALHTTLAGFSSPHTVPALVDSKTESDIDLFIHNDSSFSDFGNGSSFPSDMDLFPGKHASTVNDDLFLSFTEDQPQDPFF